MDMNQLLRALGLQQAYQAYQQNIGQPFANVAGPFGRGLLGLDRPEYGEEQAYRTGQAVGNMPAVSAPVGAFKAAMQAPGLLADATQMAKQMGPELAGLLGLTAFHGSPHRFSKFDASKIGTGEGAQAYGHGLYFAENPMVADEYRMMLSTHQRTGDPGQDLANYALRMKPNNEEAINWIKNEKQKIINQSKNSSYDFADKEYLSQYDNAINVLQSGLGIKPGSFYTVDIPDEMVGKMIDWDVSISKQPESVKSFLIPLAKKYGVASTADAGSLLQWMQTGPSRVAPSQLSEMLREAGIPGIRYLDQGSRGAGTGTRNFVVFPGEEEALKMLSVD
jgi:hypothetical protein